VWSIVQRLGGEEGGCEKPRFEWMAKTRHEGRRGLGDLYGREEGLDEAVARLGRRLPSVLSLYPCLPAGAIGEILAQVVSSSRRLACAVSFYPEGSIPVLVPSIELDVLLSSTADERELATAVVFALRCVARRALTEEDISVAFGHARSTFNDRKVGGGVQAGGAVEREWPSALDLACARACKKARSEVVLKVGGHMERRERDDAALDLLRFGRRKLKLKSSLKRTEERKERADLLGRTAMALVYPAEFDGARRARGREQSDGVKRKRADDSQPANIAPRQNSSSPTKRAKPSTAQLLTPQRSVMAVLENSPTAPPSPPPKTSLCEVEAPEDGFSHLAFDAGLYKLLEGLFEDAGLYHYLDELAAKVKSGQTRTAIVDETCAKLKPVMREAAREWVHLRPEQVGEAAALRGRRTGRAQGEARQDPGALQAVQNDAAQVPVRHLRRFRALRAVGSRLPRRWLVALCVSQQAPHRVGRDVGGRREGGRGLERTSGRGAHRRRRPRGESCRRE
jgi:hypothetical protein